MISIFQYLIKDEKLLKNTLFHGLVFEPYLLFGNDIYNSLSVTSASSGAPSARIIWKLNHLEWDYSVKDK